MPGGSLPLRICSTSFGERRSEFEKSTNVCAIDTVGGRKFLKRRVFARLKLLLPHPRFGQRRSQYSVRARCRLRVASRGVVLGEYHLASVAAVEFDRDADDDRVRLWFDHESGVLVGFTFCFSFCHSLVHSWVSVRRQSVQCRWRGTGLRLLSC